MGIVLGIAMVAAGTMLFFFLNRIFNIVYFGFRAVCIMWLCCVFGVGMIVVLLGTAVITFVTTYYKWLIGGAIIFSILAYMGSRKTKEEKSEALGEGTTDQAESQVLESSTTEPNTAEATEKVENVNDEPAKGNVKVVLTNAGESSIGAISVLREVMGLELLEAKALVDSVPTTLNEAMERAEAETLKQRLESAGAQVRFY